MFLSFPNVCSQSDAVEKGNSNWGYTGSDSGGDFDGSLLSKMNPKAGLRERVVVGGLLPARSERTWERLIPLGNERLHR